MKVLVNTFSMWVKFSSFAWNSCTGNFLGIMIYNDCAISGISGNTIRDHSLGALYMYMCNTGFARS